MSDLGKNLLWVLAAAQISCSSVQETLESAQRIDSDMTYASRVSYRGPDPSDIVGGQEVSRTDPTAKLAVLLLISRNSRLSTCTGVLIAKRVVLTAAHCVTNVEAQDVRILFRTRINEVPAGLETFAEKIRIHEKFDGKANSFSDLALLRLKSEAPPQYAPVPLFENGEKMIGDFVLLVGYGITDEKQKDSLTLRKTIKSLKNDIHIKHTFLGIEQKTNTGGFCRGDSGAPIIVNSARGQSLIGINSFTVGLQENRECHTASVAMFIPHFAKWIKANASTL